MDYKLVTVRLPTKGTKDSLPLRNLPIVDPKDGFLEGQALLIPDKTLAQVNPSVRKQAKAAGVKVTLSTDKKGKGVYVMRIRDKDEAKKKVRNE